MVKAIVGEGRIRPSKELGHSRIGGEDIPMHDLLLTFGLIGHWAPKDHETFITIASIRLPSAEACRCATPWSASSRSISTRSCSNWRRVSLICFRWSRSYSAHEVGGVLAPPPASSPELAGGVASSLLSLTCLSRVFVMKHLRRVETRLIRVGI